MFDADLLNKLSFDTRLDLALLLEEPLSAANQEQITRIITRLQQLRNVDMKTMPFGLDAGWYLRKIEGQIQQIAKYENKPAAEIDANFAFEPGGLNKLRALAKKHPTKMAIRGTTNSKMTIVQPTGVAKVIECWAFSEPQKGYLSSMIKILDKFFSSNIYKPLENAIAGMVQLGSVSANSYELARYVIELDSAEIGMDSIDYSGPTISIPINRDRNTFKLIGCNPPEIKQTETTSVINIQFRNGGDRVASTNNLKPNGGIVHVGEIADTLDQLVYGMLSFVGNDNRTDITGIACLGGGKVAYDVRLWSEREQISTQIHSDQITTPQSVITLINAAVRESFAK